LWIIVSLFLALIIIFVIKHETILNSMESFLIVNEEPKPVDVIIVLGGGPIERLGHGIRLYHSGYANKILLTGGTQVGGTTEAHMMMQQALFLGIPKEDILIEEESLTTLENAKYSLEIVHANKFKSIILVTSPYHTRRSSMIFKRLLKGIEVITCTFPDDSFNINGCWQDGHRIQNIISAYLKLIWCYLFAR
jgi:uncharacterized SAM-binding protein YcdF (DUF218 family)